MRNLAGVRSFAHYLERQGKGRVAALVAVRAPKVPKTLPKPLAILDAKRITDVDLRAGEEREPWIFARDAAVLALLYGSGLRIAEALSLKREDAAVGSGSARSTYHRQGQQAAMVPVLPMVGSLIADYVALCPYARRTTVRCVGAKGGPLSPRIIQLAMARYAAPGCRIRPLDMHCGIPCDASARARRRFARHPGIARPCVLVHHADLYGGG
jgi:integrase/recombinase XerC